jgi:predicted TIM-barrel fold metal-dependent hydrolase
LAAEPNPYLAREIARAANDRFLEQYLEESAAPPTLHGAVVVATQNPEEAAAEIARVGEDPRMVAVLSGSASFARPFGQPVYLPVLDAAVDAGLPIVIHADGEVVLEAVAMPSAGGQPATWAELRILVAQNLATHMASLSAGGTFERHPDLKVILHGGSARWLPPLLWRLDANYKALHREVPWLRWLPSEYVRDNMRLTTYPLDPPGDPARTAAMLALEPAYQPMLCFASGGDREDASSAEEVARSLPDRWALAVMGATRPRSCDSQPVVRAL